MPRGSRLKPARRRPPVSSAIRLVYQAAYLCGLAFYLPLFLWRMVGDPSYRRGIRQRMGRVPQPARRPVLWIHGVSVGEVKAAVPVVDALAAACPGLSIIVSSTTPTGAGLARSLFGADQVIYYPLDFGPFPGRALDRVEPICVLLMELEIWPNFLHAAERRGVPVAVVNGRISRRSFRGYRLVSWLLPQLDRIDLYCVQEELYASRLRALGVQERRIVVTGNLKYDGLDVGPGSSDAALADLLALGADEIVLVGGSTHASEEAALARVALAIETSLGRKLRLVVAPRHPERGASVVEELERELRQAGTERVHPVLRLTTARRTGAEGAQGSWLVVDTIGELERVYGLASLVFVGGSLVRHGGHNMLEPVALGKPTLFGPHVWNFAQDVDFLLSGAAVVQVADEKELAEAAEALLREPERAAELVARGRRVVRENRGATERTMRRVLALLRARSPALFDKAVSVGG